jgi:hypothetical protein
MEEVMKKIALAVLLLSPTALTPALPAMIIIAMLIAGVAFPPLLALVAMLAPFFTEESGLVPL